MDIILAQLLHIDPDQIPAVVKIITNATVTDTVNLWSTLSIMHSELNFPKMALSWYCTIVGPSLKIVNDHSTFNH